MSDRALLCDFGGVLTTPLLDSFLAVQDRTGVSPESFGKAMDAASEAEGRHPLYELETGHLSEAEFLRLLGRHLEPLLGHHPELYDFREIFFDALEPNEPMVAVVRDAQAAGIRTALVTNNVREWEAEWRRMVPIDELFEFVVDSAYVGVRKPNPRIYELAVQGFGDQAVRIEDCVMVDDLELNCEAARRLGMKAVHYTHDDDALARVRAALGL